MLVYTHKNYYLEETEEDNIIDSNNIEISKFVGNL